MLKAMIDTMVFDLLVDGSGALEAISNAVQDGRLALFTTHVQEDQITAVGDRPRRERLQAVPREVIPSSVLVVGFSRLDQAAIGPGGAGRGELSCLSSATKDAAVGDLFPSGAAETASGAPRTRTWNGAGVVYIGIPVDLASESTVLWVLDDGVSMDVESMRLLWAVTAPVSGRG